MQHRTPYVVHAAPRTLYLEDPRSSCINLGLPVIQQADAAEAATPESEICVDVDGGEVAVDGKRFQTAQLPPFMQNMLSSGGLVPWGRERLDGEKE